jgi:para-aminobenzoate synthetase component I
MRAGGASSATQTVQSGLERLYLARMRCISILKSPWREPAEVLAALAEEDFALGLLSGGDGPRGRWSYVLARPAEVLVMGLADRGDPFAAMTRMLGEARTHDPAGPPFQGGLAGLLGYELGARLEQIGHLGHPDWPDVACGLYLEVLAFDHQTGEVFAIGRGDSEAAAHRRAEVALERLSAATPARPPAGPLAENFDPITPGEDYEAAVAAVVERIAAGEIFQANISRGWGGRLRPGLRPIDLFLRLHVDSPAPFGAYLRLPGRAVVSNSPERFVSVAEDGGLKVEARPIKGTRPRGDTPAQDQALMAELLACEKDRAENLMIVDLMRNDLSRVCPAGAVGVSELFTIESFANVHHLVSTVTGRLRPGLTSLDLLEAAFPPGSITGAPKIQAMKVIADYEGPRGPYCGAFFWTGFDGAGDSSVLIRTVGLLQQGDGWRYEARAGAGIVADSDPHLERLETEAKIDAIRRALLGLES